MAFALASTLTIACSRKTPEGADSPGAARDTASMVRGDSMAGRTARTQEAPGVKGASAVAAAATSTATDTARGIVRRVGAEPLSRLTLASPDDSNVGLIALSGAQMSELAAAEGLEVMVRGERTNERAFDVAPGGAVVFRVQQFVVRAVDGVEARDGVLVEMNGHPFLETAPGVREPIVGLPTALKSQIGARIFLVGPRGSTPQAFGVLRKP
jgi:hypothetical protein